MISFLFHVLPQHKKASRTKACAIFFQHATSGGQISKPAKGNKVL